MFSMYDEGIWTTDDSWFEVTYESIARYAKATYFSDMTNMKLELSQTM